MPKKLVWTQDQDNVIIRERAAGTTWSVLKIMLGVRTWSVIERGRAIGAVWTPPRYPIKKQEPDTIAVYENANRPPLPPGHPITWDCVTQGTELEGTPYPN